MATTKMSHRIFAVVLAVLFLTTSLGFSGLVIWQIHKDNQAKKTSTNNNQSTQESGNKLKGTKLEGFTPGSKVTEIQKTDITEGSGEEVKATDTIVAHYTGALVSTGVIFESSKDSGSPLTRPLSGLIKGWQEGIPGMKVGGKRRLVIPAAKAYGEQASGDIPANSDLVFDIELLSIQK